MLIDIWAGDNISIHDNTFQNIVGDGIIVEWNMLYQTEHPTYITIEHNTFDGNHTNRNGVSVITG